MIEKIVDYMHWANARVIEWINVESGNSDDYVRLASHILNAEKVWICRAQQIGADRDTFKSHGLPEMAALNESNHEGFRSLLQTDLKKELNYQLFDGTPMRSCAEDMFLHAFSHGFHHVGQMAAIASRSGKKFPDVSYIGFTRTK